MITLPEHCLKNLKRSLEIHINSYITSRMQASGERAKACSTYAAADLEYLRHDVWTA